MRLNMSSKSFLVKLTVFLLTSFMVHCACPTGCTCDLPDTLSCTKIDRIPEFSAKENIAKLEISGHNITELKSSDLEGFSTLKRLSITIGKLRSIENGTFDVFKDSIIEIQLARNNLSEIPIGLFKDMPNLKFINVSSNSLQKIQNGCFENLGQLSNIFFELNGISSMEEGCLVGVDSLDNVDLFHNKMKEIPFKALKTATKLRRLDISFNNIKEIPEDIDDQLTSLEELDLESNPIASIKVFPNISNSLKILNLMFTDITSLDKNTWKNLQNLEKLYISGTLLTEIRQGMFEGLNNLNSIYLMSSHKLKRIGPNSFSNLSKLSSLHIDFNKELTEIDENAFATLNITYINLMENKLSTFQENLLNWTSIKSIFLEDNPINCDCKLTWMFKPEYESAKQTFSGLVCSVPLKYSGKRLMDLQPTDLTCGKTDRERFATGIAVAVFCFLFFAILLVVFKCRKPIIMRCRRYFMYKKYQNDLVFTVENDTAIGELDDGDTRPLKELRLDSNEGL